MDKQFVRKFSVQLSIKEIHLSTYEDIKVFSFISENEILRVNFKLATSFDLIQRFLK